MAFWNEILKFYPHISDECKAAALILGAALAVCTLALYIRGRIKASQGAAVVALAVYLFLLLSATVLSRTAASDYQYKLCLFWSYWEIVVNGKDKLIWECLLNFFMLMPVGFLMPVVKKRHSGRIAILTAFLFSSGVELAQLVTKRGWFEFDDIFHNTCGAVVGFLLYRGFLFMTKESKSVGKGDKR